MDISPEYIKMCEKAEEIQGVWEQEENDFFIQVYANGEYSEELFVCKGFDDPQLFMGASPAVWLPRQDDLQKMMQFDAFPHDGAYHFSEFVGHSPFVHSFTSMEQLWLAFVMFTLYHKKWYNGEWRVENDRDIKNSKTTSERGQVVKSNMP